MQIVFQTWLAGEELAHASKFIPTLVISHPTAYFQTFLAAAGLSFF